MATDGTESAFSMAANTDGGPDFPEMGLSKREYFAAAALQGLLANGLFQVNSLEVDVKTKLAALTAVQAADAIIIDLNKEIK